MSLNKVQLIGNLGKDPEVSRTTNGVSVAKISVATTKRFKDRSGEAKEQTEWHIARCWKQVADFIGNYGRKGSLVYIEGELHTETWERDGQKRSQTIIEVNDIQLLTGWAGDESQEHQRRGSGSGASRTQATNNESLEPQQDDLPF